MKAFFFRGFQCTLARDEINRTIITLAPTLSEVMHYNQKHPQLVVVQLLMTSNRYVGNLYILERDSQNAASKVVMQQAVIFTQHVKYST